jgi:hypothetical protein
LISDLHPWRRESRMNTNRHESDAGLGGLASRML